MVPRCCIWWERGCGWAVCYFKLLIYSIDSRLKVITCGLYVGHHIHQSAITYIWLCPLGFSWPGDTWLFQLLLCYPLMTLGLQANPKPNPSYIRWRELVKVWIAAMHLNPLLCSWSYPIPGADLVASMQFTWNLWCRLWGEYHPTTPESLMT